MADLARGKDRLEEVDHDRDFVRVIKEPFDQWERARRIAGDLRGGFKIEQRIGDALLRHERAQGLFGIERDSLAEVV